VALTKGWRVWVLLRAVAWNRPHARSSDTNAGSASESWGHETPRVARTIYMMHVDTMKIRSNACQLRMAAHRGRIGMRPERAEGRCDSGLVLVDDVQGRYERMRCFDHGFDGMGERVFERVFRLFADGLQEEPAVQM
jgi:hypothetical protein